MLYCVGLASDAWASEMPLGLFLNRRYGSVDPHRPLYSTSLGTYRTIDLRSYFQQLSDPREVTLHRMNIHLAHRPPGPKRSPLHLLAHHSKNIPFHIPRQYLNQLVSRQMYAVLPELGYAWHGARGAVIIVHSFLGRIFPSFSVILGRCRRRTSDTDAGHWATVKHPWIQTNDRYLEHVCSEDHVHRWHGRTKTFMVARGGKSCHVQLSFRPSHLNPTTTLVLRFDVLGVEQ